MLSSNEVRGMNQMGVWKFIRNGWEKFISNFRFVVGRGFRIRFRHDVAMKDAFPSIFRIALDKDASVAYYKDNSNGFCSGMQGSLELFRKGGGEHI